MRRLFPATMAVSAAVAVSWAGAIAPAWPAVQGRVTGVRPPGAWDASAIGAAGPAGLRGTAIAVPGLAALNTGGGAGVSSVSCPSAGSCAAGGDYTDASGNSHGFVASQRNGRWATAIAVPGLAALNTGGFAQVFSVSCASAGNCAAAGYYSQSHAEQGFVASERNGRWGTAIAAPGLAALNTGGEAEVDSVSCASAGNCAGGYYSHGDLGRRGFVAVERNDVWGTAIQVPGLAALNTGEFAEVTSVSCASAGSCAAGGSYTYGANLNQQGFVAVERHGVWGTAIAVPGLAALNTGGGAGVSSVSCPPAGSCAAGGEYGDRHGHSQGFVAVERNGRWGAAIAVPGLAALNTGGGAGVSQVSCASAGSCAVGGSYLDRRRHDQGFVAVERNGRWGTAIAVPGLAALNTHGLAEVTSVSCASAGSCAAGGYYFDRRRHAQWFVAVERHGRWGKAIQVPGLSTLNKPADVEVFPNYFSVSCAPAGTCAAGGYYTDRHGAMQGFVTQAR